MDWTEVSIKTTTEGAEVITGVFAEAGIKGVAIEDPWDIEVFKREKSPWEYVDESLAYGEDVVVVKGYIAAGPSLGDTIHIIEDRLRWVLGQDLGMEIGPGTMELTKVKEEDWANNWKKYFKPRKVGESLVIKPSWEEYTPAKEEIVLELDPGMAFGTGTHETTILCMRALEEYVGHETRLLDIGTGTGILAIAGVLLGAPRARAVDLDPEAVRIAGLNAEKNGVRDRIDFDQGDLLDKVRGRFDIVVANIIADAIIEISKSVEGYLTQGGVFIASGIILDRVEDVKRALNEAGLKIIEEKTMGEWAVLVSAYE